MRVVWIGLVIAVHALMRAGTRLDEWMTLRRRWTPLDAETVDVLEGQFRERYAGIDAWLRAQQVRMGPGGALWYRAWRRMRRRRVDLSVPWTLGAPSMADRVSQPARDEWYGCNGGELYPEPDHDADWLGTSAHPYRSIAAVGKRRTR